MKWSLSLLTALVLTVISAGATSFEIGTGNSNNVFPFSSDYVGEYQQIYSKTAFSGSFLISAIAFETKFTIPLTVTYNFTLSLGVTNRSPSNPGSTYSGTFTPVFSGPL